jgi:hypothetical protein
VINVERPVFLGEGIDACAPTDSQRAAIEFLLGALADIRDMDAALSSRTLLERQVLGIGSREVALFADRGMGKTSVLLTVAKSLEDGGECTVLWPPIDARALEDSETVMATTLARLAGKATEGLNREKPDDVEESRAWSDVQHGAWKSHPMYARFVAASAASAPEFGAYLIDRSRGTERLRDQVGRCVQDWLARIQKKQCVIFVDDLDQSRGRAVEALLDLERYVAVKGLAFVFAFKYDALWYDVSKRLFDGLPEAAKEQETEDFLRKTLPTDRRADLWAIPPEKRLAFAVDGRSVRDLMQKAMPKDAWYLFDGSLEGADSIGGVHADLLPSTPRGLRTLFTSLPKNRNLQGGGGRSGGGPATREGVSKVLSVLEHVAKAEDVFPVIRLVTRLREDIGALGKGKRGIANDVALRIQAHLPGCVGDSQLRAMMKEPFIRDPVTGLLPPLARLVHPETDYSIDARWQELLWDASMYLDRQFVWRTFEALRFLDDMAGTFLPAEDVPTEQPFQRWYSEAPNEVRSGGYALSEVLRNAMLPCVPDTVRRQEAYIKAVEWLQRPQRTKWLFQRPPGTKFSREQLRVALAEMACLHVTAVLIAQGAPMLTSPGRDARRLAEHINRALKGRPVRAPEVGAFLEQEEVEEVLGDGIQDLRSACRALHQ